MPASPWLAVANADDDGVPPDGGVPAVAEVLAAVALGLVMSDADDEGVADALVLAVSGEAGVARAVASAFFFSAVTSMHADGIGNRHAKGDSGGGGSE